jgi:hypothetical protein
MAEEQKKTIFRQQALDRLATPEQLNDYLHVTNVRVWVLLAIIILLLGALFVWSSIGKLETTVAGRASVTDGTARITVLDNRKVTEGMTVRMGEAEFRISEVTQDEMGLTVAFAPVNLTNGNYDAVIVVESVSPIGFLLAA